MSDNTTRTPEEEKELKELFKLTVASDKARENHSKAFGSMILEKLPEESSVRKIYTVDRIDFGYVPLYQIDIDYIGAWVMPKRGTIPQNIVEVDEVTVPTYKVVGSVYWEIEDAEVGRINVLQRAQQRFLDSIVEAEETDGWALIRASVDASRTVDLTATETGLSKNVVNACFAEMESLRGYEVTQIWVSPNKAADIRSWTSTTIDPQTQHEIWVNKGLSNIWQAEINVLHGLADTEAYFIDARPGLLGYMPVVYDLRTMPDNTRVRDLQDGVVGVERIGFTILDPLRIVKAVLD